MADWTQASDSPESFATEKTPELSERPQKEEFCCLCGAAAALCCSLSPSDLEQSTVTSGTNSNQQAATDLRQRTTNLMRTDPASQMVCGTGTGMRD